MRSRPEKFAAAVAIAGLLGLVIFWILGDRPATPRDSETLKVGPEAEAAASQQKITALETAPFRDDAAERGVIADPRTVVMPIVAPLRLTGRIVDVNRRPVADLDLRLSSGETGRTGPDGLFRLVVSREGRGVQARIDADGGDRGILASWVQVHPFDDIEAKDLGVLVLEPSFALVVRVVASGEAVAGAIVTAEVGRVSRRAVTGPEGIATVTGLVNGIRPATIRAGKSGVGNAYRKLPLPRATDAPLELSLDPVRDVTVQVVCAETGQALSGVIFEATETVRSGPDARKRHLTPYLDSMEATGADGRLTLRGVPLAAELSLRPRAPFHHLPGSAYEVTVPASAPSVRIELDPDPICRWQVIPGEAPVPPPDADLRVVPLKTGRRWDGPLKPMSALMDGTELVVTGLSRWGPRVLIAAPDGSVAMVRFPGGPSAPDPVSFQRPRSVEVVVHDTAGAPVVGLPVWIRLDIGEEQIGAWLSSKATDDDGRVRFEGFDPLVKLLVSFGTILRSSRAREPVVAVDLSGGDARIEHTVEIGLQVIARVTVGGSPGLPADARISVHGASMTAVEKDEVASTLRFRIYRHDASGRVRVHLRSAGRSVDATVPTDSPGPAIIALDLPAWPEVTVALVPPADGLCRLRLERRRPRGGWGRGPWARSLQPTSSGDGWIARVRPLEPGTYRAVDALSGAVSAPFSVVAETSPEPLVELDLTRVGWVEGRLLVPRPEDLTNAQVKAAVDQPSPLPLGTSITQGIAIDTDGSFRIRVPGDRPIALCAAHPLLVPEPGYERTIVTAPPERAELRLASTPQAQLRLSSDPPAPEGALLNGLEVHLAPADSRGAGARKLPVAVEAGAAVFSDFEPGRYDLVINPPLFAPRLLEGVSLGPTRTDLGTIHLELGGAVVVELIAPGGSRAGDYVLTAEHLEGIPYRRQHQMSGAFRISLSGLLPGRHRITLSPRPRIGRPPPSPLLTKEITITGNGTVVISHQLE